MPMACAAVCALRVPVPVAFILLIAHEDCPVHPLELFGYDVGEEAAGAQLRDP